MTDNLFLSLMKNKHLQKEIINKIKYYRISFFCSLKVNGYKAAA